MNQMGQDIERPTRAAPSTGGARPASLWEAPELPVALFSFVMHFVWEFVQVPTYTGMAEMNHWEAIKLCMSATFGDVGFALTAFWIASIAARSRGWVHQPTRLPVAIFIAVGIILTIGFEYYYTNISLRWTYSELMPLVPPFGTGLSPLLQWLVIPAFVIWLTRRHLIGSQVIRERDG
jgi:type IV secretory pathway VirB2 component (pilin)